MANEKQCPFRKATAEDFLLFRNVSPPSDREIANMRQCGAVVVCDAGGGKSEVEIIGSKCSEERCALWHEDAQECSLLSLAKAVRRISRNGR